MAYADRTTVSESKSRAEIEDLCVKNGADQVIIARTETTSGIQFRSRNGRMCRVSIQMPTVDDFPKLNKRRQKIDRLAKVEQERRRRWRALLLVIKAKFEAIESGVSTFDEEFLPYVLLPNGMTTAEFMVPQIALAYETGKMPDNVLALPMIQDEEGE